MSSDVGTTIDGTMAGMLSHIMVLPLCTTACVASRMCGRSTEMFAYCLMPLVRMKNRLMNTVITTNTGSACRQSNRKDTRSALAATERVRLAANRG